MPPRMSLDAVACLSGVTTAQLGGLNGPFDGAVVVTTGASSTGDGLGKAWVWVEGDTTAANGTTILGSGAYGRWRDATALAGGGSSAGTSVTLNPAAGQITDAGTVTASNIALAITGARVYTGLLAATGGQLVKVITNTSAFDATFNHQDGTATAANRVITSSAAAFVLKAGKSATFAYDTTAQRWRIAGQDGGVAEATTGFTLSQLASTPGTADGQVVTPIGKSLARDVGNLWPMQWAAGSTATADGGRVVAATGGRWIARASRKHIYAEEYIGALDGTNKDAALATLWSAAAGFPGCDIVFPPGDIVVATSHMPPPTVGLRAARNPVIASLATGEFGTPTRWWWDGASTTAPILDLNLGQCLEGMQFYARNGRTCYAAWVMRRSAGGLSPSGVQAEKCGVWGLGSPSPVGYAPAVGAFTYGHVIGEGYNSNAEEHISRDCIFANFEVAGGWLADGQPYHTIYENCFFGASHRGALWNPSLQNAVWGQGVRVSRGSASLTLKQPRFSRLETAVHCTSGGDISFVRIDDPDVEYLKKIFWSSNSGFYNGTTKLKISGGRYSTRLGDPSPNYSATDYYFIDALCGAVVDVDGSLSSVDGAPLRIRCSEANKVYTKGLVNDPSPVVRQRVIGATRSGGTYYNHEYLGPADANGSVKYAVFTDGCENPDSYMDISGTQTVAYFGFDKEEVAAPRVTISEVTLSGSPASGTWSYSATVSGVIATRSAAPGSGASVRVYLDLALPSTDPRPGSAVESNYAPDTLMATSTTGAPATSDVDHGEIIVVTRLNISAGTPGTIMAVGNGTSGRMWLRTSGSGIAYSNDMINAHVLSEPSAPTIAPLRTDVFGFYYTASTNTYRLFRGAELIATNVSAAPTTPAGSRLSIGRAQGGGGTGPNGLPATNVVLHSLLTFTGSPTDGQMTTAMMASVADGVTHLPAGCTAIGQWHFDGDGAADDQIGSNDITLVSGTAPGSVSVRKAWRY